MNNIKYFTFEHSRAGFTDQLRYFNALYGLGSFMRYSYLHTPFISPRSGVGTRKIPSAHEFIGVNAYFQRSGKQIDEARTSFNIIEITLPEIVWSVDRVGLFQKLIDNIFDAVRTSCNNNNIGYPILISFKLYEGNKKKFCKLIFENIDSNSELNDLQAIYSNERLMVPHKSSFKEAKIKILLHVRQGDTSILATPWNTFIPVRFKRKDFLKEYQSYSDIETSTIFSTSEIFSFVKVFVDYFQKEKISMLLFSDGWRRAHNIVYNNVERMGWSVANFDDLKASEADYDRYQFQDFSKLKDIHLHVGEEPEMLLDLIHSAVESDIIVCTSQQAMMPKLVASLCGKKSPIVIILYKNKIPDDSSIIADYRKRFIYVDLLSPDFPSWIKNIDFLQ